MRENNPLKPIVDYVEQLEKESEELKNKVQDLVDENTRDYEFYQGMIKEMSEKMSGMEPVTPVWRKQANLIINAGMYAMQLKIPYVFDKEDRTGMDCSGFLQSIFKHGGITLPRPSWQQAGVGTEVSLAEARPGDIIGFNRTTRNDDKPNKVDHVGVYLGQNQVLHTPNTTLGIHIAELSGVLLNDLVTVRRVIPE